MVDFLENGRILVPNKSGSVLIEDPKHPAVLALNFASVRPDARFSMLCAIRPRKSRNEKLLITNACALALGFWGGVKPSEIRLNYGRPPP